MAAEPGFRRTEACLRNRLQRRSRVRPGLADKEGRDRMARLARLLSPPPRQRHHMGKPSFMRWPRKRHGDAVDADRPVAARGGGENVVEDAVGFRGCRVPELPLVWRAAAREDLARIIRYIAERNPVAARRMRGVIEDAVRPLTKHPLLFRPGRVAGTRELVAHPNYVIVYRVTDAAVEIVSVLHARQQYP